MLLHTSGAPSARFARKVERVFVFAFHQTQYSSVSFPPKFAASILASAFDPNQT